MNRVLGHLCAHHYKLIWARRTSRGWWDKWDDCSPDTGFEIWALAVWGRARYLSVTEAPVDPGKAVGVVIMPEKMMNSVFLPSNKCRSAASGWLMWSSGRHHALCDWFLFPPHNGIRGSRHRYSSQNRHELWSRVTWYIYDFGISRQA